MIDLLNNIELKTLFWLLPPVQLIHELEEWNLLKWYKENFEDLPASTNLTVRVWIIFFSLVVYLWVTISFFLPDLFTASLMIFILIIITTLNSLQHIYWQFLFKKYAPGVITSVLLVLPVNILILYRIINEKILPLWLMILISLLLPLGMISTIRAKNEMTKIIKLVVHEFPIKLVKKFSG